MSRLVDDAETLLLEIRDTFETPPGVWSGLMSGVLQSLRRRSEYPTPGYDSVGATFPCYSSLVDAKELRSLVIDPEHVKGIDRLMRRARRLRKDAQQNG